MRIRRSPYFIAQTLLLPGRERGEGLASVMMGVALLCLIILAVMAQKVFLSKESQHDWIKREMDSVAQQRLALIKYNLVQLGGLTTQLGVLLAAQNRFDPIETLDPSVPVNFQNIFSLPLPAPITQMTDTTQLSGFINLQIDYSVQFWKVDASTSPPTSKKLRIGVDPVSAIGYIEMDVVVQKTSNPELGVITSKAQTMIQP